jgi:hypothetical protein
MGAERNESAPQAFRVEGDIPEGLPASIWKSARGAFL